MVYLNSKGKSMWYPLHTAAKRWQEQYKLAKDLHRRALEKAKTEDRDGEVGPRARDENGFLLKPTENEIPVWIHISDEEDEDS